MVSTELLFGILSLPRAFWNLIGFICLHGWTVWTSLLTLQNVGATFTHSFKRQWSGHGTGWTSSPKTTPSPTGSRQKKKKSSLTYSFVICVACCNLWETHSGKRGYENLDHPRQVIISMNAEISQNHQSRCPQGYLCQIRQGVQQRAGK